MLDPQALRSKAVQTAIQHQASKEVFMNKLIQRMMLYAALWLGLSGCSLPSALETPEITPLQKSTPPLAVTFTASPLPATSSPTRVINQIVPVTLAELVLSDLTYLPIKSLVGSATPYGKMLGWLSNTAANPVGDIEISLFFMSAGKKVSLGKTTASFAGSGQRVFFMASVSVAVPDGAQLGAEVLKFKQAQAGASAAARFSKPIEPRGLFSLAFPKDSSTFITGELYNPSDQPVATRGAVALWYNAADELVHVSSVDLIGHYIAARQAVPFRIDAAFKITKPDAGVRASDLKRYELIVNSEPLEIFPEPITFQFASTPFLVKADKSMIAFAEATNTTDQWQDVNAYWAGYNQAGQVIGMFKTSMLGSVLAPGETRPIQFPLILPGGLKLDQAWASQVTRAVMFDNYSQSTEPLLTLDVRETKVAASGKGFAASMQVQNNNTVKVSETSIVVSVRERATGKLVMVREGRIVKGDNSDVVYAKPLAAGQSWPVQSYFELPVGLTLEMVDITYSARGK